MSGQLTGSKKRSTKAPYAAQKGVCSWCGTDELPKGRRSWCSQECVDEYLIRSSSAHVRTLVEKRDGGICADCGCNADEQYKEWLERRKEAVRLADRLINGARFNIDWVNGKSVLRRQDNTDYPAQRRFRNEIIEKYAPGNWTEGRVSGWDADHIVPVVEGGGECGLDNYRTLCHPCHKKATAELAKRRAEQNRKEKRIQSGDLFDQ